MKREHVNHWGYSIRRIMILLAGILLFIAVAGISYIHSRQQKALIHQAAQSQYQSLESFITRMDDGLDRVESQLYNVLYHHSGLETLDHHAGEIEQYQAKQEVADELSQIVQLSSFVECAWFYSPKGDTAEFLARNNYTGVSLRELLTMQDMVVRLLDGDLDSTLISNDRWSLIQADGQDYLFWMTPVRDSYCGAWVGASHLKQMLEELLPDDAEGDELLLCSLDGRSLFPTDSLIPPKLVPQGQNWSVYQKDYVNICGYSQNADIAVEILLTRQQILKDRHIEFDYAWACAVMLLFVFLSFGLLQGLIYHPFQKLLHQMDIIRLGNPDMRLRTDSPLAESAMLGRSINSLLDKINQLNAQIYETELNQRDIQCQYLQIRLKTHFYLNCLSIIHAMARMNHTELIQELSTCLVKYLRFVEDDTDKFVRLENELEHVRNYARIQELRFPRLFEYREEVSVELFDAVIPPLMLQTFIENSVEHGMNRGQKNWIRIEAYYEERNQLPGMHFVIQDNGRGFMEEDIKGFSEDPKSFDLSKSHGIGIRNVISRLKLLYEGKADIQFENASEGGAKIQIWIPFLDVEEDT